MRVHTEDARTTYRRTSSVEPWILPAEKGRAAAMQGEALPIQWAGQIRYIPSDAPPEVRRHAMAQPKPPRKRGRRGGRGRA